MNLEFLTKYRIQVLFRIAAILTAIYFILRVFPPSNFFLFNYPFLEYGQSAWWAPRWLVDYTLWGSRYYGIASPLLLLSLLLTLAGIIGWLRHFTAKNDLQNRPLLQLTAISTSIMLLISVGLGIFTFPYLPTAQATFIPEGWNMLLFIMVAVSAIISFVSFVGLVYNLAVQNKFAAWAIAALAIGLGIMHFHWLSFFLSLNDLWGGLPYLLVVLGIGWSIGLWQIGKVVAEEPVDAALYPQINWRKTAIIGASLVGLWFISVAITFAWDARNANALCAGSQDISEIGNNKFKVVNHGRGYTFTYTNSSDLTWHGSKYNASDSNQGGCSLTSWVAPNWTTNAAFQYLPFSYSLVERFVEQPTEPVARFTVHQDPAKFRSVAEYKANLEQKQAGSELVRQKHPSPEAAKTTYTITRVGDMEALLAVGGNNGANVKNRYESYTIIEGDTAYTVGWGVLATTNEELEAYINEHRDQFQAMIDSFRIK